MNLQPRLREYLRVYPQWRFIPPRVQIARCVERFGSDYGGYWLDPSTINSGAIVYSLGIGEDISFDDAHDGEEAFYFPSRHDWVSHSVIQARQYGRGSARFPVMRLSTAMKLQGHSQIDVLKMDIEGAEYAVIEEIVRERIPVTQMLVEFHHRLSSVGTDKTRIALSLLERYGMKISYVCPRKEVFTLVEAV
jgi:FkbM family methyltransferase